MQKVNITDQKEKVLLKFKDTMYKEAYSLIKKRHSGAEGKNLATFAGHIFDSITDYHFIRDLEAEDLYHMALSYYVFFSAVRRPLDDRFECLPAASVNIFNPSDMPECKEFIKRLEFEATAIQVCTVDGPFIFESIWNYLKKKGIHIFNAIHPVLPISRCDGKITEVHETLEKGEKEAFVNIYIEKIVNPVNLKNIELEINRVLCALFMATRDFRRMMDMVACHTHPATPKKDSGKGEPKGLGEEEKGFLKWLCDDNFIFMGTRKYDLKNTGGQRELISDESQKLGVFRDVAIMDTVFPGQVAEIEERLKMSSNDGSALTVDFFNSCSSTIYHFDPIDYICIDHFDLKGDVVSKTVLFGRFSRGAKFQKSSNVPILRQKVKYLRDAGKGKFSSYYRREFFTIFNQIPKRELFYLSQAELRDLMELTLSVQSDENVEVFAKNDRQDRYLSLFVIMSRGKYSRPVRERIKSMLLETYKHPLTRWETVDCFSNTLLVFYMDTRRGGEMSLSVDRLETSVKEIISTWDDRLARRLVQEHGDRSGFSFYNKYRQAFSGLYKEITDIDCAVSDILYLEKLEKRDKVYIQISRCASDMREVEIKLYSSVEIDLMTIIPTAQNLGLYVTSEQVISLDIRKGATVFIHIFKVSGDEEFIKDLMEKRGLVSVTLTKALDGHTVNDQLNHLALKAGFTWKVVELVRALKSYLLQIDSTYSPNSIDEALIKFVDITKKMFSYFEAKFKPDSGGPRAEQRTAALEVREKAFFDSLTQVSSLGEDQILRGIFDIVKNSLRTNFYKSSEANYISFKIDCGAIAKMPSPRPLYEIYVHSPELEGVHLRGGLVARGGLRWSDRYDDFRTEVLGLMKTQMVKNAVIVPEGSKGGFVLKRKEFADPREREAYLKEQYQIFISGLLDITDNIKAGEMAAPDKVVTYDEFDPYLVVAADKGTAKLSDAANEISKKYKFWLGDAFASGGAVGYDHKKTAITARGAWESVKRHFREKGVDVQEDSVRVVGIGDMAGDVFGNGMLLSRKIKLVAAFNHIHIFLDPDPDPEKSWDERTRLFKNPRLGWMDYSRKLISKGGGVFPRSSKSISISPEAKKMLGISKDKLNGEELIRDVLRMEADLLWNGGIGTYIKSSRELHLDVGDRSNDRVRVDAGDLRFSVLGEGGNLGATQLARIEASEKGVICNTDALDNSGGVDTSDHEVNIKILLSDMLENGELQSNEERNKLFIRVTDEVVKLVIRDNYLQSSIISMDRLRSAKKMEHFLDYIDHLESAKVMSKKEEFIPDREELARFEGSGIPRPILAVLLGYGKIFLFKELLHSKLLETVFAERYLDSYFPEIFQREYPESIRRHRLKKEIISTVISNKIINQAGMAFFFIMGEKTGREPWEIARAYIIIENMLKADEFRKKVHELDNNIPSDLQYKMLIHLEHIIFQSVEWMLSNLEEDRVSFDMINLYKGVIENFKKNLVDNLETVCSLEKGCLDKEVKEVVCQGVPKDIAEAYAVLPYLKDIMPILKIKEDLHYNFIDTGNLYIKLNNYLYLDWVEECLDELDTTNDWEEQAAENLYDELKDYQNRIVADILKFKRHEESIDDCFNNFMKENADVDRAYKERINRIKDGGNKGLIAFSVLVRSLKEFLAA